MLLSMATLPVARKVRVTEEASGVVGGRVLMMGAETVMLLSVPLTVLPDQV